MNCIQKITLHAQGRKPSVIHNIGMHIFIASPMDFHFARRIYAIKSDCGHIKRVG